jgi:Astacin (Peptidase family M12A)
MAKHNDRLRAILSKLSNTLDELLNEEDDFPGTTTGAENQDLGVGCVVLSLPEQIQVQAARTAIRHNPRNAGGYAPMRMVQSEVDHPEKLRIALSVDKFWGRTPRTITVSFMEQTSTELRNRILSHMNAWSKTACISFAYVASQGTVRISRAGSEFKSYIGTDVLHVNLNFPTMWLGQFSMSTPESEYLRVVRHETGHTLGFPHEHLRKEVIARLDPHGCYAYFARGGWNRQMVDSQVLTPINSMSILATSIDEQSIMCYSMPGSCTKDGKPVLGGEDISDTDYWFAGHIYPKPGASLASLMQSSAMPGMVQHQGQTTPDQSQFLDTALEID